MSKTRAWIVHYIYKALIHTSGTVLGSSDKGMKEAVSSGVGSGLLRKWG